MWKRLAYAAAFTVISWFGCGVTYAEAHAPKSGVVGNIRVSPSCPGPQRMGQDCVAPYVEAKVQLLNAAGAVVGSATTDRTGHFTIRAPVGDYQVRVDIDGPYPRCESTSVHILSKTFMQADILCDSGMR